MFGRNDFLGEVMLPLSGQVFDHPASQWHSLQDRVSAGDLVTASYGKDDKQKDPVNITLLEAAHTIALIND